MSQSVYGRCTLAFLAIVLFVLIDQRVLPFGGTLSKEATAGFVAMVLLWLFWPIGKKTQKWLWAGLTVFGAALAFPAFGTLLLEVGQWGLGILALLFIALIAVTLLACVFAIFFRVLEVLFQ
jgi:hypothetical protein